MKHVFVAAFLLLLAACVPNGSPHVSAHTDAYNPNTDLDGPMQTSSSGTTFCRWQLHSLVNKQTHEVNACALF